MAVKTGTTTFGQAEIDKYKFDADNYSKDSWVVGYTSNYTLAVWQGFDSIDGPTKYMTESDTQKTQILYRINMQNIVSIHRPGGFSVPKNVGSINGGVKIITESERRQIEEQQKRQQEENSKKNQNNDNNNDNNDNDNNDNNSNSSNNNNNNSNNTNSNNSRSNNNANSSRNQNSRNNQPSTRSGNNN